MYKCPESFGLDTITDDDYDDMPNWPAMTDWYNDAVADGYSGTYDDYVAEQQARCSRID